LALPAGRMVKKGHTGRNRKALSVLSWGGRKAGASIKGKKNVKSYAAST